MPPMRGHRRLWKIPEHLGRSLEVEIWMLDFGFEIEKRASMKQSCGALGLIRGAEPPMGPQSLSLDLFARLSCHQTWRNAFIGAIECAGTMNQCPVTKVGEEM